MPVHKGVRLNQQGAVLLYLHGLRTYSIKRIDIGEKMRPRNGPEASQAPRPAAAGSVARGGLATCSSAASALRGLAASHSRGRSAAGGSVPRERPGWAS